MNFDEFLQWIRGPMKSGRQKVRGSVCNSGRVNTVLIMLLLLGTVNVSLLNVSAALVKAKSPE